MSTWPSTRARRVYQALVKIGWKPIHQSGSHVKLRHSNYTYSYIWAFHDGEELGPKILARIAKKTGLTPADL